MNTEEKRNTNDALRKADKSYEIHNHKEFFDKKILKEVEKQKTQKDAKSIKAEKNLRDLANYCQELKDENKQLTDEKLE